MGRLVSVVAWTLLLVSAASSGAARAQSAPAPAAAAPLELTEYEVVIRKALTEFNLGHWSEAKTLFQRAHELRPSARTLRSLGLTSFELRQYVAALGYLQQSIASQEHPLTDEMRKRVLAVIDDCKSFIIYKPVRLQPTRAKLQVDGEPAALDANGALMLDPGEHNVTAEADGFESVSRELVANGGDRGVLEIKLSALAGPASREARPAVAAAGGGPARADEAASDASFWSSLDSGRIVGLGLGAAGVIGVGLGVTFSVLALNADSDSKAHCDGNACDATGLSRRKTALSHADAATVSLIAAGALLGAGLITFLAAPGQEREHAGLQLRPALAPGVASLALTGAL